MPQSPFVRIDKFMKVARLAKRRTEAHDALEAGRIERAGRPLKPGAEVHVGDVLVIRYARKTLTVAIREVPERVTPSLRPADLYEVLEECREDAPF